MYHAGDVQIAVDGEDDDLPSYDSREPTGYEDGRPRVPCAYLPHSCAQWIIGGPEEIEAMIADLRAAQALLRAEEPHA